MMSPTKACWTTLASRGTQWAGRREGRSRAEDDCTTLQEQLATTAEGVFTGGRPDFDLAGDMRRGEGRPGEGGQGEGPCQNRLYSAR